MPDTLLEQEAAEAAAVVERQCAKNAVVMSALAERLRTLKPAYVVTCARGSSDHAATYGKYLIERVLGLPVASLGPSLASVYDTQLRLSGSLFLAISQSGRSPDILKLAEEAKRAGALVVGLVNDETSPLAELVDVLVPLRAGPERSVAATKSFLGTCTALLQLVAAWSGRTALLDALERAPRVLREAGDCDWSEALLALREAQSLYVVGRGLGLGIAQELALKLKETCRIHAEAFSAAEVLHGPFALVGPGFPAFVLDPGDEGGESSRAVAERFASLGASPAFAGSGLAGESGLPMPADVPVPLVPLAQIRAFYGAVAQLAIARGLNPDRPPHLSKVTRTT